jgi:hypothetical protein
VSRVPANYELRELRTARTTACAKLIECVPQLVRDTGRIEDIRKVDGDDPADAAPYGLVSSGSGQIARPVTRTDQTSCAIHYQRLEAEASLSTGEIVLRSR